MRVKLYCFLLLNLMVGLGGCGGDDSSSRESTASMGNGASIGNSVVANGGYERVVVGVEKRCVYIGDAVNGVVYGENADFSRVNITGGTSIDVGDSDVAHMVSHSGESFSAIFDMPGVTFIKGSLGDLSNSVLVGAIPKWIELPVIARFGCSYMYFGSKGSCGLAYEMDKGGGGFRVEAEDGVIAVNKCKVIVNSQHIKVVDFKS